MPKNNGKSRKVWRRKRATDGVKLSPEERLLASIFGGDSYQKMSELGKPNTKYEVEYKP